MNTYVSNILLKFKKRFLRKRAYEAITLIEEIQRYGPPADKSGGSYDLRGIT